MKSYLQDQSTRQQALNPLQSFIVQAPAGSGKTELLVRRYLILLARVQFPESIIALTFTRKAAAEMQERILATLEQAACASQPTSTKEKDRDQLAQAVLQHDKKRGWNLLQHPDRFRIQTIDSFCQRIAQQTPLQAHYAELNPDDHPRFLYQLAAQALLNSLNEKNDWQSALLILLEHLDNNWRHVENLLTELLATRDQWLRYMNYPTDQLRAFLENNLQQLHQQCMQKLNQIFTNDLTQELYVLLNFSREQLQLPPLNNKNDTAFWQAAAQLLLKQDLQWRQQVTKQQGFPTSKEKKQKSHYEAMKQRFIQLQQKLTQNSQFHTALIDFKQAPPLFYTDTQWNVLNAIIILLPVLVAELKLIFQQIKKVDYIEILLAASAALGHDESPSDLALQLDYQIEHLLVDEFQDTSMSQFQFLQKLIAGWQIDEGRTVFFVGDPMQSIYRFRKAEVGLFLQVQQYGFGSLHCIPLTLRVNFRSQAAIVNWINQCFKQALPCEVDIQRNAIPFTASIAFNSMENKNDAGVITQWFFEKELETQHLIQHLLSIKQKYPNETIALLIRARTHLAELLPALKTAGIPYQADAIETLADHPIIHDLVILTRALSHLGDRIAWFALLRSPWCGLNLHDLHAISQYQTETLHTLWQQLSKFENLSIDSASKQRCRRFVPVLQYNLQQRGEKTLSEWIKSTWMALGGPTVLNHPDEMIIVDTYFDYLEKKIQREAEYFDPLTLSTELERITLPSTAQTNNQPIHLLTLHKAKGLEFDHVFIPYLHRSGTHDKHKLLLHHEYTHHQSPLWLLAPIKSSQEIKDELYEYLLREEKYKAHYELTRLLYVACTRAKKTLYLSATLEQDAQTIKISSNSLLQPLHFLLTSIALPQQSTPTTKETAPSIALLSSKKLQRLSVDWQHPYKNTKAPKKSETHLIKRDISWELKQNINRLIGIGIHKLLYRISQDGFDHWKNQQSSQHTPYLTSLLKQIGITTNYLPHALKKVQHALHNILNDARSEWILNPSHRDAQSEYALSLFQDQQLQTFIIDRTFIDKNNIRWIIDYKTTEKLNQNDTEKTIQRHRSQLENYATAFALPHSFAPATSIRLALYFPLLPHWEEWEFKG